MRKLAAILALVVAVVLFAIAVSGYFANRAASSALADTARKDLALEIDRNYAIDTFANMQSTLDLQKEMGKRGDAVAVEKARKSVEDLTQKLGGRSSREEDAKLRDLDVAQSTFLWEAIAGSAFLIVSLLLFSRRPETEAVALIA
jgi:membrane protein involved in colicin uptake